MDLNPYTRGVIMLVIDAMSPRDQLITAEPDTTVIDAMQRMVTNRVGSLVIIENEDVVGIITARDLMNTIVVKQEEGMNTIIRDVMSTKLLVINERDFLSTAVEKMDEYQTHHILVKSIDGQISGILSSFDIVREMSLDALRV